MVVKSRWSTEIPETTLQSWIFGSADQPISDRLAIADANKPDTHFLTLSSWRQWAKRLAVGLQKAGLEPEDRVLVFSGNNLTFPVAFMGILMANGIFTGANPTFVARELTHQLRDSGSRFLFCADTSLDVGLEAAKAAGLPESSVFVFDANFDDPGKTRQSLKHWTALFASVAESEKYVWDDSRAKERTCCLNYSSGTTGVPKGVEITHYNYVANSSQSVFAANLKNDIEQFRHDNRWLCFLPLYHAMAQSTFLAVAQKREIPVYMMSKFDFIDMLEAVEKYRITDLILVPPIAVALSKHPAVKKYNLNSVRGIICGAAPLSRATSEDVEKLWEGAVNLKQGWGMTEATCSILGWNPNSTSRSSSVGELNANCEAKVMNDDGTAEVQQGKRGELWVRGPNVMKGYWRNPSATAATKTADGWLKTGDICYVDKDSHFFVVDRRKELIKVKGNQVAPAELEALLLEHPAVADAAVVGVTINGEEVPRAYCVPQESQKGKIHADDIVRWFESRVARYKRLVGGVVFVDAVPKNPSGKILRRNLRDRAREEVGDKEAAVAKL